MDSRYKPIIHVAYADDHELVRKGVIELMHHFEEISIDIEAENGKELIQQIEKADNIPDVCIIDINMPVMNGFDTIIHLKRKWPEIKVLVLTVFNSEMYIIRMLMNGANGYLLKNCPPNEIKKAICHIYDNDMYYSESITRNLFYAVQDNKTKFPFLTESELLLLKYSCTELSYSQIADVLGTTTKSIEGCRDRLFKKFNTTNRVSLALLAVQFGLVPLEVNDTLNKFFLQNKNKKW